MGNSGRIYRAIMIVTSIMLITACAAKPPEDIVVKGSLQAVDNVNPDAKGRASPLVVKIFQLKSKDKFESADFFPLFDQADATLGEDLLAVEDQMLAPGELRSYEGKFDPATRYIGVIAAYRDINQAHWKDIIEMPEKSLVKFLKKRVVKIDAQSLAINISVDD